LHVEDNADWLRIVRRICEGAGFSVRHATSLGKAASLLNGEEFDAIIADIRLKDWQEDNREGLEALTAVPKERRPAAVVLSGFLDGDNTRLAFKTFEVSDVIKKSAFEPKEFIAMVKEAVRETQAMRRDANK
jgi:DNA-binding response OmpR family regulator